MPGASNTADSQDPTGNPYKFEKYRIYNEEDGTMEAFYDDETSRVFRIDRRGSQDATYVSGISPPSHSDPEQHPQGNMFTDFPYGGNSVHSKRPSLAGTNGGFPNQITDTRTFRTSQTSDDELRQLFARNQSRSNGPNSSAQNGSLGNDSAYGSGNSQTFQLNPGSQPWENWDRNAQDIPPYSDHLNGPFAHRRGGAPAENRGSPAGSGYHPPIGSPKSFSGTPQPGVNPWAGGMAPRDPRLAPDVDRRNQGQQQFLHGPIPYHHNFYNQNYLLQLQQLQQLQGTYGATHANLRGGPMQVPPIPDYHDPSMNPYLQTAGIGPRPNKHPDPAKGIRSHLLEEFRSSPKSNNRYELKV